MTRRQLLDDETRLTEILEQMELQNRISAGVNDGIIWKKVESQGDFLENF